MVSHTFNNLQLSLKTSQIFFNVEIFKNAAPHLPGPRHISVFRLIRSDQLTPPNGRPLITQHFVFNWSFQHIFCLHWNRPRATIQASVVVGVFFRFFGWIYFYLFFFRHKQTTHQSNIYHCSFAVPSNAVFCHFNWFVRCVKNFAR